MAPSQNKKERIEWPKRAVVTAGMPYGNKSLHFGHVGGVFVPADCYARFLRDRIGPENVVFVSGTDCFGSPIEEGYRKEVESVPSREPWKTMFVATTIARRQRLMRTTLALMCTRAVASAIAVRSIALFLPPLCSVFMKRDSCIWRARFSSMTLRKACS